MGLGLFFQYNLVVAQTIVNELILITTLTTSMVIDYSKVRLWPIYLQGWYSHY